MTEINAILETLFGGIAGFAGLAALVALLVQVGKQAGWITDGNSGKASAALNLVAAAVVYFVRKNIVGFDFASTDAVLGEIASVGTALVALFFQIGGSKAFYMITKWAGVVQSKTALTPPKKIS